MANNVGERNSMLPTSAGTTMELSTGTESEGDREETSLFTLMARVPTLKQAIDSSDVDNYRETSARFLLWCHQVSQASHFPLVHCTEELEKCLAHIMSEPSMEFVQGSPLSYDLTLQVVARYKEQSRYHEVVEMCNRIIEQVGDTEHLQYFAAWAWKMLGEAYLLQGQITQGEEAREKVFKLMLSLPADPSWLDNVDRYSLLSMAYLDNGKPRESKKHSAKALRYLKGKEEPWGFVCSRKTKLNELLGKASEQCGDLVRAVEYYQESLRILKAWRADRLAQSTLYYQIGGVQRLLGHYIEAISTFKQGLIYAEQCGHVNPQFHFLSALVDTYRELVSPEYLQHNSILDHRQAKEALQRYTEAYRNRIQSYTVLGSPPCEIRDVKHAEEELKSSVEQGELDFRCRASFYICEERLHPESPNRDIACAREAFEECQKCLKAWDSQNGNELAVQSQDMRLKLAFFAFSLGELEKAEEILKVLLRSYERILDNLFSAGDASEELVLKFRESTKMAFRAMIWVQLKLVERDSNLQAGTTSSQMPTVSNHSGPRTLSSWWKTLIWSERARARTVMIHLAPGFRGLNLQPGDKREFKGLWFPDTNNFPYDHNPKALMESFNLHSDPLLDTPWRHAIKDHIGFNFDDSYALSFIGHAVRDSKMAFVEYFIFDKDKLFIIVLMAKSDSTNGSLMDGSQNLAHVEEGVFHGVELGFSLVDMKAKLHDDDKADALEETKGLAQTVCFLIFSVLEQDKTFNYNEYIL